MEPANDHAQAMIDLHSHLLPFVDDGAESWDQARTALLSVAGAGVRATVVTPHVRGSLASSPADLEERLSRVDDVWPEFVDLAAETVPKLAVMRAAEVMLDRPDVDLSDPRLRLDGGRFALVEFPRMLVPPRSAGTLGALKDQGWTPVLAHPERYRGVTNLRALAREWRESGAVLQVNAGSLLGWYGDRAKASAILLLQDGATEMISSDYHARGSFPSGEARALLRREYAAPPELLQRLFEGNAAALLEGRNPEPVEALPRRVPAWKRIFARGPGR